MQNAVSTLPGRIVDIVQFRIQAFKKAINEAEITMSYEVAMRFSGSSPVGMRKNFHYYFTNE